MIAALLVVVLSGGFIARDFSKPTPAKADAVDDLRAKSVQLQSEIDANNQRIKELGQQAASLQAKLDQLSLEIVQANKEIELTTIKIEELQKKLEETQTELDRQKQLLKESMRLLYKKGGASTIELMVSSDSFSQFINNQEYLDRLKSGIQASTEEVIRLKQALQEQRAQQEDLKKRQEAQRNVLAAKQEEQQTILNQTKGEQARYEGIVEDLQRQLVEAEDELRAFLARSVFVSLGRIRGGQLVGAMGSTGYSTGPHVHFTVVKDGNYQNPRNYLGSSLGWPAPDLSWGNVSQEFGCVAPAGWYASCGGNKSFHTGLDIAGWYGSPIVAAADGDVIFRGCRSGLGYVVIIDHGGGLQTYYPHMITPGGQTTGYCNE